jgi:hypothetical protein
MDRSRKATREGNEATFHYQSRQAGLLEEALIEDKLSQLQAFIAQLEQDPTGKAQLERRTRLFGECEREADQSSADFYARLHRWLEREIPQTKSPLHPPRQMDPGTQ